MVKSAKSKSESTFLSKVTHVSLKANSSGQLSCQLSLDKEGHVCTQVSELFCTTFFWFPLCHPFIESLKGGEGKFQVRACLARPREIQSQKNRANPNPAGLPSLPMDVAQTSCYPVRWIEMALPWPPVLPTPAFLKQMEAPH